MQAGKDLSGNALVRRGRLNFFNVPLTARRATVALMPFHRSELHIEQKDGAPGAAIDFIELRQGQLPEIPDSGAEQDYWLTPFQTQGWLEAWQARIGAMTGATPVTAIGYADGQPVFKLPLAVVRRFGASILTWCAYPQSDYTAPIVSRAHVAMLHQLDGASIMRQVASRLGSIDLVYMPKQLSDIHGVRNPFVLPGASDYHVGAHAINFVPGESWEQTYMRRRSGKTRKRLREKRAALEKLGAISFHVADSESSARAMIDACLTAKTEQLMKLGHWDPFSPPGVRDFLLSFFGANVGQSSWAVSLNVNGKPAATAFGFSDRQQWLLYQMAMPGGPEAKHSPGTHLLMELMQHCIAQGAHRLDLALGDEPYKAEWCDEHQSLRMSTLAFSLRGRLLERLVHMRSRLRSRMASDAKLYERAKWVKGMARKLWLPI